MIIIEAFNLFRKSGASRLSAALSFFLILSTLPILAVTLFALSGFFTEAQLVSQVTKLSDLFSPDIIEIIKYFIQQISIPQESIFSLTLWVLLVMWAIYNFFTQLRYAFNKIWAVIPNATYGRINRILRRLLISSGVMLIIIFIIGLSLFMEGAIVFITSLSTDVLQINQIELIRISRYLFTLVLMSLALTSIFKIIPETFVRTRAAVISGLFVSLLYTVMSLLLNFYFSLGLVSGVYGAAGSIITVLLWILFTSNLILFGAALANVIHLRIENGSRKKSK